MLIAASDTDLFLNRLVNKCLDIYCMAMFSCENIIYISLVFLLLKFINRIPIFNNINKIIELKNILITEKSL